MHQANEFKRFIQMTLCLPLALGLCSACSPIQMVRGLVSTKLKLDKIKPHVADLPSGKMKYYSGGEGFPIIFIHGFGTNALENWGMFMGQFKKTNRVFAPDLYWFGKSRPKDAKTVGTPEEQADAIAEFMKFHHLRRAHIVGASFGGYVALAFALRHPQAVARLVIADGAGLEPTSAERKLITSTFSHVKGDLGKLLVPKSLQSLKMTLQKTAYKLPPIPDFVLCDMLKQSYKDNREQRVRLAKHLVKANIPLQKLRAIRHPTTIFWGRHDRLLPPTMGQRMANTIPHAKLFIFEKSGHVVMSEQPFLFQRRLKKALLGSFKVP